jgi:hypothetical protein
MLSLTQNKQTIYYALYENRTDIIKDGLKTGSKEKTYSDPVAFRCNVSPARGVADEEQFGINTDYDRTIVTTVMDCPIQEDSILWVGIPTTEAHNYRVIRKAVSLNSIVYAIKEVSKS